MLEVVSSFSQKEVEAVRGIRVFDSEELSHEKWGRHFGRMLTGSPSPLLQTVKYSDDNLERIVEKFLSKDLPEKKLKTFSFRIPVLFDRRIKEAAAQNGFQNPSELVRSAVEKYLIDR